MHSRVPAARALEVCMARWVRADDPVPQLDESIKLILMYEDCFVGASAKVCWADMVTHSIEAGVSRPVKQPPQRTSCEEKDQIECQLSESLLEEEIRVSESPWASPVLCIWQESGVLYWVASSLGDSESAYPP